MSRDIDSEYETFARTTRKKGKLGRNIFLGLLATLFVGPRLVAMVIIGRLAWNAMREDRDDSSKREERASYNPFPPPIPRDVPEREEFIPSAPEQAESRAQLLLAAMVAAAKADGSVSDAEWRTIEASMEDMELAEDDRRFLIRQMGAPLDLDGLVATVEGPAEAAEVYTASLLVIDKKNPAEAAYLSLLASRLRLDADLTDRLERDTAALMVAG